VATVDFTAASVKKAVAQLRASVPRVPPCIVEVIGDEANRAPGSPERAIEDGLLASAECALAPVPWFRQRDGKLESPQLPFFGFYALRNAVRGAILGSGFLAAGRLLLAKEFYGPSVAMFYTASFHLCHAFLALHGRVTVVPVLTEPVVIMEKDLKMVAQIPWPAPEMLMCTLTRDNRWIVENRGRSHRVLWREIGCVLREDEDGTPPEWLSEFFAQLRKESPEELAEADTDELLCRIADLRHRALYEGFGMDETALNELSRSREISALALSARASEFEKFATRLQVYILGHTVPLLLACGLDGQLRTVFVSGVYSPGFDMPTLEWVEGSDGYELFERLMWWMTAMPRER
jgi:hypothetical protein